MSIHEFFKKLDKKVQWCGAGSGKLATMADKAQEVSLTLAIFL